VLGILAVRTVWTGLRVRAASEVPADADSRGRAYATAVGATASNPSTILSWAAIFAAASSLAHASAPLVVIGVGAGSLTWVTCLAGLTALVRRNLGATAVATADVVAGAGMLGFAGVLGYRTVRTL
jgi:threonine/homoserine/homoserine lactone efflux protein